MKKLLLPLFIIHFSLFIFDCPAQDRHLIDSLQAVLETGKQDTNRANILYQISKAYWSNDPVKAMDYARQALSVSEKIGFKKGMGNAYNIMGVIRYGNGEYKPAMEFHEKALKIRQENGDKKGIAASYANIGLIYSNQGNYPEALKYYFASLKISEEIGNKKGIAYSYLNIGTIYVKQKKYNDAAQYLKKSLSLTKEIGHLEDMVHCYMNLAIVDSARGDFRNALEHHQLYLKARDSLKREETAKKLQQMEFQKQLLADSLKQEEEKLRVEMAHKEQMHRQKVQKILLFSAIAMLLVGSFGIWRRLRYTRKAKAEIEKAKGVIEKEKERSENLLLNILPSEVAEEIKQDGRSKARTFSMVTVMFTDFMDFTAVSERYSAELLVAEIDYCFSAFDNIIQKYNIEKIKTIGDAYMCAGGMPVLTTTHAVDVVNAAIEIRNFMLERKKEQDAKGGISFELRLGVHTGPVVAGIVGVKKYAYDIWGDTVNIAARMEQNSEAGKINISGSTYKLVKDKFNCVYRGKIEAKNKGEVEMYFVEK